MVWRWSLLLSCATAGCYAAEGDGYAGESYMVPDQPPYNCMDGSTSGPCETTGEVAIECAGSSDCPADQICTATFDGDIGRFRCESLCVVDDDQTSWCFDDDACCDSTAICLRGLCIAGDGTETGSSVDSSTSGDASSTSSTSSGDATSTSSGSGGTG